MKTKMRKNLIRAMVFTTLCSLSVAVSFFTANVNASAESLEAGTFEMIPGASVRIGSQLVGNPTNDMSNGIRFSAEIDVETYNTLKAANDTVTAGTFIMPYDYIDWYGALTEENCFGDDAIYYWQTAGFEEGETPTYNTDVINRKQIRHVSGNVYKTESEIQTEGETPVMVYRVNGSLVNILDENLGRSMIGVSYLAATKDNVTTYYFAETDAAINQRSIAHVSQNILLKDGEEGKYSDTATEYLQKYVTKNTGLTVEVKADCYEINENGYVLKETIVDQTVTIDEIADFTAVYGEDREEGWAPTLEGYTYVSGHQKNVETGTIKLDGSASYEYYFYANNNYVLYDGSYAATVAENLTKFMGQANVTTSSGLQINNGWTPNAYEIDTKSDGLGSICGSKYETGFGVGEALRWCDFGSDTGAINPVWSWENKNSYVEFTPSMKFTYTMRVKTIQDPSIEGWQDKTLNVTFGFLNTAKNPVDKVANVVDQIQLKADNNGWYIITGTLDFTDNGAAGKYLTKILFQTSTATNIHLDIDYISLTAQ